ncbi:hypothetical protein KY321_00515 [Candidatus Woesearchaeota archaeon]|nr:hypothetical protein [Candidatus Woesearchaeota archaeon]
MIYEIFQNVFAVVLIFLLSWLFMHLSLLILNHNSDKEYNVKSSIIISVLVYVFYLLSWYAIIPVLLMYFIILYYYKTTRKDVFKIWILWLLMFILIFLIFSLLTALIKPF